MSKRRRPKSQASQVVKAHVPRSPSIEVRRPESTEENFRLLFDMLLELHKIGGYAPVDYDDAAVGTYDFLATGVVFIAYVDGEPAGAICGVELPYWYNRKHTHLQSLPIYVRAKFRNMNIGARLLRAFQQEGERRGIIAFATVDNPDRKRSAAWRGVESLIAGFVPLGYTMKLR